MAADLHEALTALLPTDWADVPQHDGLKSYMQEVFTAGELICISIPPPPQGTSFDDSRPHFRQPNTARSFKEMHASSARAYPPSKGHEDLQTHWGKPMKFSAKDNPLNVSIHKMAGNDRHGAWFGRRSVHEGLGFNRFKAAMMREFPETLAVQGGPGEGSIRGIGGDQCLEKIKVDGAGTVEVYQLSAQFPGPVTPREFITLLLTGDTALSDKSAADLGGDGQHVPRHFMIVSKPIKHPNAPDRPGYIRGQYESVELIREIPLHRSLSQSTPNLLSPSDGPASTARDRGATISFAESRGPDAKGEQSDLQRDTPSETPNDPELNPVEWIMITRSDPGGGIPRFMVERGTPSAMIGDMHKFLNWATTIDDATDPEGVDPEAKTDAVKSANEHVEPGPSDEVSGPDGLKRAATEPSTAQTTSQDNGVVYHLTQALEAGLGSYAPANVSSFVRDRLGQPDNAEQDSDSDTSDSDSDNSFASAEEMRRLSSTPQPPGESSENVSLASAASPRPDSADRKKNNLSQHEKELLKLTKEREKLDRKLAKKREEEEAKLKKAQKEEESEGSKARERYDKEIKKQEDKHRKEMEKLESKKEREARKAEERRRKQNDRDNLSKVTRERDEFRGQVDLLKRENALLHEQLGDLQRENTAMVTKLGKLGGPDSLQKLREEMGGQKRTASMTNVKTLDGVEKKSSDE